MKHIYNDGGRADAGYKGDANDCVVRAIAIANDLPYKKVYLDMMHNNTLYTESHRGMVARQLKKKGSSPRNKNFKEVYHQYILSLGWRWTPTMHIGQGCKTHMRENELPGGKIIVRLSKHLVTVIDGVIHDTHDPSRNGMRCVYGYYSK